MFRLLAVFAVLTLSACSSAQKSAHHHHDGAEFNGKCSYSVAHGRHDVKGKEEFSLEHKGKTYFFSSGDLRDHFKNEIEENITQAEKNWKHSMERGSQR